MTDRLPLYLQQMQRAAFDACDFVKDVDQQAFLKSVVLQRAVGMSLLMLGEIVIRLAKERPEFLVEHPEIPWQNIQGLRNRIAHGYFDIDLNIIWETTKNSLPDLLSQLDSLHNWRAQGE